MLDSNFSSSFKQAYLDHVLKEEQHLSIFLSTYWIFQSISIAKNNKFTARGVKNPTSYTVTKIKAKYKQSCIFSVRMCQ